MLRHCPRDGIAEHLIGVRAAIRQERPDLILERLERGGIESRRSELEIDELEQRLDVLWGRPTAYSFARLADACVGRRDLPGELLLQVRPIEFTDSAQRHD